MITLIMYGAGMQEWAGHMPVWYILLGLLVGVVELGIWTLVMENK